MQEFSTADFLLSFLFTWIVVLTPPLLIRVFRGRPIDVPIAIGICTVFYFINLILFIAMGSQSKTHAALFFGAWISYYVLRRQTNSSSAREASEERKSLGYEEPQPEGAVQSEIVSLIVQPDTQSTHHRWYQKALHRPMARLNISFIPTAIVVFLVILIGGYLEVQAQAESYARMKLNDLALQAVTQQSPSALPIPGANQALDEAVMRVAKAKERCDAYLNNNSRSGSGTGTDFDALLDCVDSGRFPKDLRIQPPGDIWMNLHDKVPGALLVWLAISTTLFALLTAISIFKLETNSGWKRLSGVVGTIASGIVFSGMLFSNGAAPNDIIWALGLGLVTLPLAVLILLGGRNIVGWIKSGFDQN